MVGLVDSRKFPIMSKQQLAAIAMAMVAPGKGLLAMDESNRTCNERFEDVGIAATEENRSGARQGKCREEMEQAEPALVSSEGLHLHLSSQD
jgi:fructose-bisphosphate aldolase class 1